MSLHTGSTCQTLRIMVHSIAPTEWYECMYECMSTLHMLPHAMANNLLPCMQATRQGTGAADVSMRLNARFLLPSAIMRTIASDRVWPDSCGQNGQKKRSRPPPRVTKNKIIYYIIDVNCNSRSGGSQSTCSSAAGTMPPRMHAHFMYTAACMSAACMRLPAPSGRPPPADAPHAPMPVTCCRFHC